MASLRFNLVKVWIRSWFGIWYHIHVNHHPENSQFCNIIFGLGIFQRIFESFKASVFFYEC